MYCGVLWAVQAWHRHLALDVLLHETLLWLAAVLTACMQDIRAMNDHAMKAAPRKTGAILLGGGMLCLCMSAAALFCCCSGKHSCGTPHSLPGLRPLTDPMPSSHSALHRCAQAPHLQR